MTRKLSETVLLRAVQQWSSKCDRRRHFFSSECTPPSASGIGPVSKFESTESNPHTCDLSTRSAHRETPHRRSRVVEAPQVSYPKLTTMSTQRSKSAPLGQACLRKQSLLGICLLDATRSLSVAQRPQRCRERYTPSRHGGFAPPRR